MYYSVAKPTDIDDFSLFVLTNCDFVSSSSSSSSKSSIAYCLWKRFFTLNKKRGNADSASENPFKRGSESKILKEKAQWQNINLLFEWQLGLLNLLAFLKRRHFDDDFCCFVTC